jgi:hypothetical protein
VPHVEEGGRKRTEGDREGERNIRREEQTVGGLSPRTKRKEKYNKGIKQ